MPWSPKQAGVITKRLEEWIGRYSSHEIKFIKFDFFASHGNIVGTGDQYGGEISKARSGIDTR